MELTALALRSAAQKLRPYFKPTPVIVLTDQPLRSILHKPDLTGRMLQWAIELSEFGIEFQPRLSKKGQVMADFVLEYSRRPNQHHESSEQEWWTLRVDGASRSSGSGVGLVLQSPTGEHLEQAIRLGFSASNNEAEYEAILSGLDLALGAIRLQTPDLQRLATSVRSTLQQFTEWTIEKIKRADNRHADALAGIAASLLSKKPFICPYMYKPIPLSQKIPFATSLRQTKRMVKSGRHDIAEYLRTGTLPEDSKQAHKIRVQAARFTLIGGHLYKRSFTGPYLSLSWAFRSQKDAAAYVQKCDKCQRYAPIPHMPSAALKSGIRPMAFRAVGHGYSGTPPSSTCPEEIPPYRH
ncbi:hypothetical protein CK203_068689 [Vitis vinifera]|uniref:Reverse transcriptase RNase H-like domain-containing protein n=1 Tax=Vitis vinifera TaxID=29760 RepID=A0A438EED0_VITVI|nr:hypothetical protein CK203_068689 [Vitis vinifera]